MTAERRVAELECALEDLRAAFDKRETDLKWRGLALDTIDRLLKQRDERMLEAARLEQRSAMAAAHPNPTGEPCVHPCGALVCGPAGGGCLKGPAR